MVDVPHRFQLGVASAPEGIVPVPTWAAAEAAIAGVLDRAELARSA